MITQAINLNLIPGGVLPRFNVSQYDKGSRTLQFTIYNGLLEFEIPSGSTVYIQGTKRDKTGFQYQCEYQGNIVTADITQQMTMFPGDVTTELVITDPQLNILGTCNFIIAVEQAALSDDTLISETELPLIEQAMEAALIARTAADSAEESSETSESWAQGTRNGVPVGPTDPAYQKNAQYIAENMIGMVTDAQFSAIQSILS